MSEEIKVVLGKKASVFHDQATGITITKGEVKVLTHSQRNSKRISIALSQGHLSLYVEETDKEKEKKAKEELAQNLESIKTLSEKGMDASKIAEKFNLDTLKAVAVSLDIEPEDSDTKAVLVEAILEQNS